MLSIGRWEAIALIFPHQMQISSAPVPVMIFQTKSQFSVEALEQRILLSAVPMDGSGVDGEEEPIEQSNVIVNLGEEAGASESAAESADGGATIFSEAQPLDEPENIYRMEESSQAPPSGEPSPESASNEVSASDSANSVDEQESETSDEVGAAETPDAETPDAEDGGGRVAPELPGLVLEDSSAEDMSGQVIYLDFNGAGEFDYAGPVEVFGADQPAFALPEALAESGLSDSDVATAVAERVQSIFGQAGLTVVTGADPPEGEHSTVFIGGDDAAFEEYGRFHGLAEAIDVGNRDRTDRAFVFSETIALANSSSEAFVDRLTEVTAHEVGRLLGYANEAGDDAAGALSQVANEPEAEPERPVLIVPGIVGTFPAPGHEDEWFLNRGIHPEKLMVDPLAGFYDDLIESLGEAGNYTEGENLFVANYDWRLPTAPVDNDDASSFDGSVPEVDEASITDGVFEYAVDYFGYWLEQAKEAWSDLTGTALEAVDVITHSTGGLVARSFLQSDAYPDASVNDELLPEINDLFMVGVPNQGAAKPLNALADNWANDISYRAVVSKIANRAYDLLLEGNDINGPDHTIEAPDASEGIEAPAREEFIELYAPTIRGLLATYDFFIDDGGEGPTDLNGDADERNPWLLDLNAGLGKDFDVDDLDPLTHTYDLGGETRDPNSFLDQLSGTGHIIYSQDVKTTSTVQEWAADEGPDGTVVRFDEFIGEPRPDDTSWLEDISEERGGDGTVPTVSAIGQFETDPRFDTEGDHFIWLFADTDAYDYSGFTSAENHQVVSIGDEDETPNHTSIMGDFSVQSLLLDELVGAGNYDPASISTGLVKDPFASLRAAINYGILDPSELFTDADWGDIADGLAINGLQSGLNTLEKWFGEFAAIDSFQQELPLLERSVAEMADFEAIFEEAISGPLRTWLGDNEDGRISDFVGFFSDLQISSEEGGWSDLLGGTASLAIDASRVAGGFLGPSDLLAPILDPDDIYLQDDLNEVRFFLPFEFEQVFDNTIVLPDIAHSFGIDFGQSIDLEFTLGLTTDLEFGYDLREGLDANERFFIRNEGIEVSVEASADGVTLPVNLGLLDIEVDDGSIDFETTAQFGINPFFNNGIGFVRQDTLNSIDGSSINDFISFDRFAEPTSSFDFNLPFDLDRPGFPLVEDAVLSVSNLDAFTRAPEIDFLNFEGLEAITNLGASGLDGIVRGIELLLSQVENMPALKENVPFLDGLNLEEMAQFSESMREDLTDRFRDEDGVLQFNNLTEFVAQVANWLEIDPETILADFAPAVELPDGSIEPAEYRFRFVFDRSVDFEGDFHYSEDFGGIAVSAGTGDVTAAGSAAFEVEFSVELDPQTILAESAAALPTDGELAETQTLSVLLNGGNFSEGEAVDLVLDPDEAFTGPTDIVDAINDLILATPLAGLIRAELGESDALVIRTDFDGPNPSLQVNGADGLGFGDGFFDSIDPLAAVTIEALDGSADLLMSADNLNAFGRVGFVETAFSDGGADFDFEFAFDLLPGGEPTSLRSLTSEIVDDPASVVPEIVLQTTGALALGGITVRRDFMEDPAVDAEVQIEFSAGAEFPFEDGFTEADFDIQYEGDFNNILDFEGLGFAEILSMISDTLEVIETLSGSSFMDSELPVINRSLNDLLNIADAFLDLEEELEDEGPQHIQRVAQILEDAVQDQLDRISSPSAITAEASIEYDEASGMLSFDIPYVVYLEETLKVELDALGDISGLDQLVDLQGSGTFDAEMTAFLRLLFEIDLNDPLNPDLSIMEGTGVGLEAYLNATDIEFDAAVGPLGIFVRNGTVALRADDSASAPPSPVRDGFSVEDGDRPHDPAFAFFGLDTGESDRIALSELSGADFAFSRSGVLEATFPIFAPTEGQALEVDGEEEPPVSIFVDFEDIGNPVISGPDFSAAVQQNLSDGLGAGLGLLFFALEEFASGEILGLEIPFVGDQLATAANFLLDVREEVEAIFDDAAEFTETELRDLIYDALGPDGSGLDILQPIADSGLPDGESAEIDKEDDIRVEVDQGETALDGIEIEMRLGQVLELLDGAVEFDLALPGLDLTLNELIGVNFTWAWHLTFGVDREDGFYLETRADEDIEIGLEVVLPPSGMTGRLGFITFTADPRTPDPEDPEDTVYNGLDIGASVNLNPNGNGNERLTLDSLSGGDLSDLFVAEFNGQAGLDWTMELGFASLDDGEAVDALPSFLVDILLFWDFADFTTDGSGSGLAGDAPIFEINDPRLDVGTFFADFLRPIAETINGYLEPLRPVLDFISAPISPLSFDPLAGLLGGSNGEVTLLDMAVFLDVIDEDGAAFINAAMNISEMIDMIADGDLPDRGSGVVIPLGDFDFSGLDLQNPGTSLSGASITEPEDPVEDSFDDLGGDAAELFAMSQALTDDPEAGGFEFQILEPEQLLNLISGEDADFFSYRLPELSFFFDFSQSFPIYSPPTVELLFGAGFGVQANLAFGYSSRGVQAFLAEDGSPSDLFGGFYVLVGEEQPPQLSLTGYVSGGASVGVPPLKGVAQVIVDARADFNLVDPGEGRLYFDQIAPLVERDGLVEAVTCLFFIEGDITGTLRMALELDLLIETITLIEVDPVGPIELASFGSESECFSYLMDDRLEDVENGATTNDTRGTAADIGTAPGTHLRGASISSFDDIDWYRFETLQAEEDLVIEMEGEDPSFELSLYDANGSVIDYVEEGTSRARIVADIPAPGEYFIKIESADDRVIGGYDLDIMPSSDRAGQLYYVNDPGVEDPSIHSFYTLAPGHDGHAEAGLSPDNPAESVQTILDTYGSELTPDDLILVDSGVYGDGFTLTGEHAGLTVAGAPTTRYTFFPKDVEPGEVDFGTVFAGEAAQISIFGSENATLSTLRVETDHATAIEIDDSLGTGLVGMEAETPGTGIAVLSADSTEIRGGKVEKVALGIQIEDSVQTSVSEIRIEGVVKLPLRPPLDGPQPDERTIQPRDGSGVNVVNASETSLDGLFASNVGTFLEATEATTLTATNLNSEAIDQGAEVENSSEVSISGLAMNGSVTHLSYIPVPDAVQDMEDVIKGPLINTFFVYSVEPFDIDGFRQMSEDLIAQEFGDDSSTTSEFDEHMDLRSGAISEIEGANQVPQESGRGRTGLTIQSSEDVNVAASEFTTTDVAFDVASSTDVTIDGISIEDPRDISQAVEVTNFELRNSEFGTAAEVELDTSLEEAYSVRLMTPEGKQRSTGIEFSSNSFARPVRAEGVDDVAFTENEWKRGATFETLELVDVNTFAMTGNTLGLLELDAVTDGIIQTLNEIGDLYITDSSEVEFPGIEGANKIGRGSSILVIESSTQISFTDNEINLNTIEIIDSTLVEFVTNAIDADRALVKGSDSVQFVENNIELEEVLLVEDSDAITFNGNNWTIAEEGIRLEAGDSGATSDVLIVDNQMTGNAIGQVGIRIVDDAVTGVEIRDNYLEKFTFRAIDLQEGLADVVDNKVTESEVGIRNDSMDIDLRRNEIHSNGTGLEGSGMLGNDDRNADQHNEIYENETGVRALSGALVAFNRVFENTGDGVLLVGSAIMLRHNLIYRNREASVRVSGGLDSKIHNNTIFSDGDYGIRLEVDATDNDIRNNITWSSAGVALSVEFGSDVGLVTNYNNWFTSEDGTLAYFQKEFVDLLDWQIESGHDLNSIGYTVVDPTLDQPQFVDFGNDDYRIVDTVATTINRGDPDSDFTHEPGPDEGGANGLAINLGAYGNTTQAALSPARYTSVIAPAFFTDYEQEQARLIVWEHFNIEGTVDLELHREGEGMIELIDTVAHDNQPSQVTEQSDREGSFFWSAQSSGIPADEIDRYKIHVVPTDYAEAASSNREPFSIVESDNSFYVNDSSSEGTVYTNAVGDHRNTGLTPDSPKASLYALLQNYELGSEDTVFVDDGSYINIRDFLISSEVDLGANEAFTLTGPEPGEGTAFFNRADDRTGTHHFQLLDADFVTLRNLTMENAHRGIAVEDNSSFSTLENLILRDQSGDQIFLSSDSERANLSNLTLEDGGGYGIRGSDRVETLVDSTIRNHGAWGVYLANPGNLLMTGNLIEENVSGGLYVDNNRSGTTAVIGSESLVAGEGNRLKNNSEKAVQVELRQGALFVGNTVARTGATEGSGRGVETRNSEVRANVIHGHATGIFSGTNSVISENRIFENADYGIYLDSASNETITRNVVSQTDIGIYSRRTSANTYQNNLIYETETYGLYHQGGNDAVFENQTIYVTSGDALRLHNASGATLKNNIFHVREGAAIRLDPDSQTGFSSDFNLFDRIDDAVIGSWAGADRTTFSDWRNASFEDASSLEIDPVFVDPAENNFHLQSMHGWFENGEIAPVIDAETGTPVFPEATVQVSATQSPGIDRGDDTTDVTDEPDPNGNFVNIGAYGNTAYASQSPEEYVLITRPQIEATWPMEQTFEIRWRSHDFEGEVDIRLLREGESEPALAIGDGVANTGSYSWTLPDDLTVADDYRIEIERSDDAPLVTQSLTTFAIVEPINEYFVNDDEVIDNGYTTAEGDNSNDGLSPATPKASVRAILDAYDLGENDIIFVDGGTYDVTTNILLEAEDSGLTIQGYFDAATPGGVTLLDRGSTGSSSYLFEFDGASDVTFRNLTFTGAFYAIYGDVETAENITVEDSSFIENREGGIRMEGHNPGLYVDNSAFIGDGTTGGDGRSSYGIWYQGGLMDVTNSYFENNTDRGIRITSVSSSETTAYLIENNEMTGSFYQIDVGQSGSVIRGNELHGTRGSSGRGISLSSSSALIEDNLIYEHGNYGIYLNGGGTAENNTVHDSEIGIWVSGSTARGNTVYNNDRGIRATGGSLVIENQVFDNADIGITGETSSSIIRSNDVSGNARGIYAGSTSTIGTFTGVIEGNLVYDNTTGAIQIQNSSLSSRSREVLNNTVLQTDGYAIDLINTVNTTVENNILIVDGEGIAVQVDSNSVNGTVFNHNLYDLRGNSVNFAKWGVRTIESLPDWHFEIGQGFNSVFADPLFVDEDASDFRLLPDSPAIASGNPDTAWANEPGTPGGRVNLGAFGNTDQATPADEPLITFPSISELLKLEQGSAFEGEFIAAGFRDHLSAAWLNANGNVGRWADISPDDGISRTRTSNPVDTSTVNDPAPDEVYETQYETDTGSGASMAFEWFQGAGDYDLRLHFMDPGFSSEYIFDVVINGETVIEDLDVEEVAGGGYVAHIETVPLEMETSGHLELSIVSQGSGRGILSGIEIVRATESGVPDPRFAVEVTTDDGSTWDSVATNVAIDNRGTGTFNWSPDDATVGPDARFRVTSESGPEYEGESASFVIANDGNEYFVNDGSLDDVQFVSGVGDNLNTGKDAASPMRSFEALLNAYDLGEGETVYIDGGTYQLAGNVKLSAAQSGLTIIGADDPETQTIRTVFDRNGTGSSDYGIELEGAAEVTLENLTITGARTGLYADNGNAPELTLHGMSFINNDWYGVDVDRENPGLSVTNSRFITDSEMSSVTQRFGLEYNATGGSAVISGNEFFDLEDRGLQISGTNDLPSETLVISENLFDRTGRALTMTASGALIEDNIVRNNRLVGIDASGGNTLVRQNIIEDNVGSSYGRTEGISVRSGAVAEFNTVSGSTNPEQGIGIGIQVGSGSIARSNTISNSDEGIRISAGGPNPQIVENTVFNNDVGINAGPSRAIIAENVVRENRIGILGGPTGPTGQFTAVIENNLILSQEDGAILFFDSTLGTVDVRNNTIIQEGGYGIRLENATDTFVDNNILVMEGGRAIEVDSDSVVDTEFNYNLYDLRDGADFALWAGLEVDNLADWYYEVGQGFNSIFADPLFADESAGDYSLLPESPAIAAGDPDLLWLMEPTPAGGRVNMGADGRTFDAAGADEPSIDFLNLNDLSKLELGMPFGLDFLAAGFLDQERFFFNVGEDSVEDWRPLSPLDGNTSNTTNSIDRSNVSDPAPEAVYQSSYITPNTGAGERLDFELGLSAGEYTIRLHFAQLSSGNETMDVFLDGNLELENFSPYETGDEEIRTAVVAEIDIDLADSRSVALALETIDSRSRLNGIEIIRHRDSGVPDPRFLAEASYDNGGTWETIAEDVEIDAFQRGSLEWTPEEPTDLRSAVIRLSSSSGPAASVVSDSFLVADDGNEYYINDSILEDLAHTTAVGNNLNSGKSPDAPMASLTALLNAYTPGEGDTIFIDSGEYRLTNNTRLTEEHSGLTIVGANNDSVVPDARTILDRDNISSGSIAFELSGTEDITLRNFEIENARTAIEAGRQDAHSLTIDGMTFRNNDQYGIDMEFNRNLTVTDSWFGSDSGGRQRYGLQYSAGEDGGGVFTGNTFMNHSTRGMAVSGHFTAEAGDFLIVDNTFHNNSTGLEASRGALVENNVVYENSTNGLNVSGGNSVVRNNEVFDNTGTRTRGILISSGVAEGNIVYNNTRGIQMSGSVTVQDNRIYENEYGIWGSSGLIEGNRVFGNTAYGIYVRNDSPTIISNQVYSNRIGMQLGRDGGIGRFSGIVENNIVYDNNEFSIRVLRAGNANFRIANNTIYHPVGRALDLSNLSDGRIANNIVVIEAGFALTVDSDSQGAFTSERNLFFLGSDPNARFGEWGGDTIDSLAEWQSESGLESNSKEEDPRFFDISGADDVFGYREVDGIIVDGGEDDNFQILGGSSAIDAGETWWAPQSDFAGSDRRSDPGTSNTGGARYAVSDEGESLFESERGDPLDIQDVFFSSGSDGETIDLPFDFAFYDQVYDSVYVAGSGLMQFASSNNSRDNSFSDFIDGPNIAAMWENIDVRGESDRDIYYDDSVDGEVYFRWEGRSVDQSDVVRFAVLLSEDGTIRFDYGEAAANDLIEPTVGISYGNEIDYSMLDGPYDEANSVSFSFAAGIADIGAFEFQGDSDDGSAPVTLQTTPQEIESEGSADPPLSNLAIAFSEAIEFIGANSPATYELILDSTGTGNFTSSDTTFELVPTYNPATFEVELVVADSDDLEDGSLPEGDYRLTVFSSSLRDVSGNQLDGNGDGNPGGDYIRFFSVGEIVLPEADFTVDPAAGDTATEFTFDGAATTHADGSIESFTWDFGDENSATGEQVTHTFATSGSYTVSLTVTDTAGFTDTSTATVEVANQAPVAVTSVSPDDAEPGETLTFDARDSFDPDGFLTSFEWDFGDGESATGDVVTHSYETAGTYTATLTVTDDEGGTDTVDVLIEVSPQALEIVDFVINEGATQRSVVDRIDLIFNADIGDSVATADLQIFDRVAGAFVESLEIARAWNTETQTLTLSFPNETGESLPDGAYTLVVEGESITAPGDTVLDANGDGSPGGTAAFDFHRLFGDVTGTGAVSTLDALRFRAAFGSVSGDSSYRAEFDAGASSEIDGTDRAHFEANLGVDLTEEAVHEYTDPPARTIVDVVINEGAAQRSMLNTLDVTFDYVLESAVSAEDFRIFNRSSGDRIDTADLALSWTDDGQTARIEFSGLNFATLPDGFYTLALDGDIITFQDIALDGDGDGAPGGVFTQDFHRLYGDGNGSGVVSTLDALSFREALNSSEGESEYRAYFDHNADAVIDGADRAVFEDAFNRSIDTQALTPLILTEPPAEVLVSEGDTLSLNVSVLSETSMMFTWYRDDEEIASGSLGNTLEIEDVSPADYGSYRVEVTNEFGAVESRIAEVTANS